jgi:hypothetical protein
MLAIRCRLLRILIGRGRATASEGSIRPSWSDSARPVPRLVLQPLQTFLRTEQAGGILLLAAAVVALLWANSPWQASSPPRRAAPTATG